MESDDLYVALGLSSDKFELQLAWMGNFETVQKRELF